MKIGNKEYKHIAVTDANGAVLAVISDDDQHICYSGVQLMPNATFYEVPYKDTIMICARPVSSQPDNEGGLENSAN